MEVSYRRDLNHNYMIIEGVEISGREYTVHMMERNHIPGLLNMNIRRMNGSTYLYYEISSRQPLTRIFENSSIDSDNMKSFFSGILDALAGVHQYLLDSQDLLLDPEYIYMDIETKKVWLCYVPGWGETSGRTLPLLAEFVLKKLHHGDWLAVELGYQFYGDSEQDNFNLQETLQKLISKDKENYRFIMESNKSDYDKNSFREPNLGGHSFEKPWEEFEDRYRSEDYHGKSETSSGKSAKKREDKTGIIERDQDSGKSPSVKTILICAAIVVVLAAGFGFSVWFFQLDLTQTGGLAFLLLAIIWVVYYLVSGKRRKKPADRFDETQEDAEEAFMEALMSELYESEAEDDEQGNEDLRSRMWRKEKQELSGNKRMYKEEQETPGTRRGRKEEQETPGTRRGRKEEQEASDTRRGRKEEQETSDTRRGRKKELKNSGVRGGGQEVQDISENKDIWKEKQRDSGYYTWSREKEGISGSTLWGNEEGEDLIGETQCLVLETEKGLLNLMSLEPAHYGDIVVKKESVVIGKLKNKVDIYLPAEPISRIHAKLEVQGTDSFVTDLNSMNGTFLNGELLKPNERRQIFSGDKLSFATWSYVVG